LTDLKYFWKRISCSASFLGPVDLARPFEEEGRELGGREVGRELGRELVGLEAALPGAP
jgi:hypothetical protein